MRSSHGASICHQRPVRIFSNGLRKTAEHTGTKLIPVAVVHYAHGNQKLADTFLARMLAQRVVNQSWANNPQDFAHLVKVQLGFKLSSIKKFYPAEDDTIGFKLVF